MKNGLVMILVLLGMLSVSGWNHATVLCKGFLPENSLRIPVTGIRSGGLSETEFNTVLDKISKYYTPIVAAKGGTFQINRLWTDETVNASANREGSNWYLNMYGGLARYSSMNSDGFLLVACHETGHHLGGAPKFQGWWGATEWASNEGEADYYATLRCMRFMFQDDDNRSFVTNNPIDPVLKQSCTTVYSDVPSQDICMRAGQAAMTVSKVFHDLSKDAKDPHFETPDISQVSSTNDDHPATQCRLDTYYQSSLCVHDTKLELSDTDFKVGTCTDVTKTGTRPRCWFQPDALTQNQAPNFVN